MCLCLLVWSPCLVVCCMKYLVMFIGVVSLQSYVLYVILGYVYWCGLLAELCAVCNTWLCLLVWSPCRVMCCM